MHHPRWLIVAILVAGLTVAALDLAAARWIDVRTGSVGIAPWADDHRLIPNPDCEEPDPFDGPCALRYAFQPGGVVTVWMSVRNAGPVAVTLRGPSKRWLAQDAGLEMLGRPIAALDGGDPHLPGGMSVIHTAPFEPVTLEPGSERLVAIEFVTSRDSAYICGQWSAGTAQGYESAPIGWHWLVLEHEAELGFDAPIEFEAPEGDDCSATSRTGYR